MSKIIRTHTASSSNRSIRIQPIQEEAKQSVETITTDERNQNAATVDFLEEEQRKARQKADQLLEKAKAEAKQIEEALVIRKEQLEQEAEEQKAQAQLEGYEAGFAAGESQASAIYETKLAEAQRILEHAQVEVQSSIEKNEPFLIDLAVTMVERILGQKLEEADVTFAMMKQILQEVREFEMVKVYVHPHWYEQLVYRKEELYQCLVSCKDFQIIPDIHSPESSCVITTNAGRLDASLDTQLKQLKHQLMSVIGREHVDTTY
ncbi:flagellar assembly protein FliH [Shouchella sp. 1P09AA]|uniref:flagellar assembly protein FliH n=1 Tax=unclassified Shouchella TaxID=2893065 RepID=UPI0039A1C3C2